MSDLIWNCETIGVPEEGITVGQIFELKCGGNPVVGLSIQTLGLELPKPDRYRLKVLSSKAASETGVHFQVTGYQPGPNSLENVVLTDGLVRITLTGIKFEVGSVLSPLDQDPKPFPPESPVGMMWPVEVIGMISTFVVLLIALGVRVFYQRRKNTEFQSWLTSHRTPLSPMDQLNKEFRRVAKERNPLAQVQELEKVLREYLARELRHPVLDGSPKKILKAASHGDRRVKEKLKSGTVRLFGELDRLKEGLEKKSIDETEALSKTLPALLEMAREYAQAVQNRDRLRGTK